MNSSSFQGTFAIPTGTDMITLHFDSVEEAEAYSRTLELECHGLNYALAANLSGNAKERNAMKKELVQKEEDLDELYFLINQLKFPLL